MSEFVCVCVCLAHARVHARSPTTTARLAEVEGQL